MDREYTDKLLADARPAEGGDSSHPQAVLHAAYDAIIRGDYEAFGNCLTPDAEMTIHGFGPMNGTWRGRAEVVAATRKNFGEAEDQQPIIEGMVAQDDTIVVRIHESGVFKSSRKAYSSRGVQWFTFAEGKIKKIDEIVASIWKTEP
jgi:ketosteroid isomerase-like protein